MTNNMRTITETRRIELVKDKTNEKILVQPFPFNLNSCKRAFTTRNVDFENIQTLITGEIKPQAGDLVLCEVTRLRQHCRIEQPNGRRSRMFIKDKIIVCYGNRYAPDQFEALVPDNLDACHLVAGGGIASLMRYKSPKVKPATEIQPLGLIGNKQGHVLNLNNFNTLNNTKNHSNESKKHVPVILVSGSSMNAGKTTTVACIIKGLVADGYNVGAAKITGTGSGGDLWHFIDAGVDQAIDFTDAGFATTYLLPNKLLINVFHNMVAALSNEQTDVIVIEVADGILQGETKTLLESDEIIQSTSAMFYTAGDSTSAIYGTTWLKDLGYDVLAISGVVSSNPLGKIEIQKNIDTAIVGKKELTSAGYGHELFKRLNSGSNKSMMKHSQK